MYLKTDYIDLYAIGAAKLNHVIQHKLGGRFSFKDTFVVQKGISGLEFIDQIEGKTLNYRVTAELFRKGIGMYFRTYRNNYFLPVPFDEIESIHIVKDPDHIFPMRYSLFRMMNKVGISYLIARNYLTAIELGTLHPIRIEITKINGTRINLVIKRINPIGIFNFFLQPSVKKYTVFKVEQ